jgi:hypothetical protein
MPLRVCGVTEAGFYPFFLATTEEDDWMSFHSRLNEFLPTPASLLHQGGEFNLRLLYTQERIPVSPGFGKQTRLANKVVFLEVKCRRSWVCIKGPVMCNE